MTGVGGCPWDGLAGEERPLPNIGDALLYPRLRNRRFPGEEAVSSSLDMDDDSDEDAECDIVDREEMTVT